MEAPNRIANPPNGQANQAQRPIPQHEQPIHLLAQALIADGWDGVKEDIFEVQGDMRCYRNNTFPVHTLCKLKSIAQTILHPEQENIEIEGINLREFFSLLIETFKGTEEAKKKASNILIGATGVGKSALINYMLNGMYELNDEDKLTFVPTQDAPAEFAASRDGISVTLYPKSYENPGVAPYVFCDSPGVVDNRTSKAIQPAIDLGFCDIFQSADPVRTILLVADLKSITNGRLTNFGDSCKKLCEIVQNFEAVKSSIIFVITNTEGTRLNIEGFLKRVKKLQTEYSENPKIAAVLHLMNESNVVFADMTTPNTRIELNQLLAAAKPIEKGIDFHLMGDKRRQLELFIDGCFRRINATQKEVEFLEGLNNWLKNQISETEKKITSLNQTLAQIHAEKYSRDRPIQSPQDSIEGWEKAIRDNRNSIAYYNNQIAELRSNIHNIRIKDLDPLKTEQAQNRKKLAELDTADPTQVWTKTVKDPRFWFLGMNYAYTEEVVKYSGIPFVNVEHQIAHDAKPSQHHFKVLATNPSTGEYRVEYTTDRKVDGYCVVNVLAEKRVKEKLNIDALGKTIKQLDEAITPKETQIAVHEQEIRNKEAAIATCNVAITNAQTRIAGIKQNNLSFENDQNALEAEFNRNKAARLADLQSDIQARRNQVNTWTKTLETTEPRLEEAEQRKKREAVLHKVQHIELLKKAARLAKIETESLKAHMEDPTAEFECEYSMEKMVKPYQHRTCSYVVDEKAMNQLFAMKVPCPNCRQPYTPENVVHEVELQGRINQYWALKARVENLRASRLPQ